MVAVILASLILIYISPSANAEPSTILGTTGTAPYGITIDSSGNIYTTNNGANNVSKITPAGVSTILGTTGALPCGITIDSSGNIYTANNGDNNVSKITVFDQAAANAETARVAAAAKAAEDAAAAAKAQQDRDTALTLGTLALAIGSVESGLTTLTLTATRKTATSKSAIKNKKSVKKVVKKK